MDAGILAILNVGGTAAEFQAIAIHEIVVGTSDAGNLLFRLHSIGQGVQWSDGYGAKTRLRKQSRERPDTLRGGYVDARLRNVMGGNWRHEISDILAGR